MKQCALTHRRILCSLEISLPLLEATFSGLDSIVAERLEVHFKQPNRHVDFLPPTKSTTEADHAKQISCASMLLVRMKFDGAPCYLLLS